MKKRIFAAIAAAVILCGCSGNNDVPAKDELDILREQLAANGIAATECDYSPEDNVLSVTIVSETDGDTVSADDITALRRVRNILRYELNELNIVSSASAYNEVLKNSVGDILSDSDINITRLPDFEECKRLLENAGTENKTLPPADIFAGSAVTAYECRYEPYIGNVLHLTVNGGKAYSQVNEEIADIIYGIDSYNKDNYSVQQLVLQVTDNGRQIFYMEADLVYRDFLWRQAPEMEDTRTSYLI